MFLIRQIKVELDDTVEILAKENGRICSKMDFSIITGGIRATSLRNGV